MINTQNIMILNGNSIGLSKKELNKYKATIENSIIYSLKEVKKNEQ